MSNEVTKVILARRSIRKYVDTPVEREKIDKILECACSSPSAMNMRPWHFIEITERKTLKALADAHPHGKMLAEAPLAIAVCGEKDRNGNPHPWWEHDCGAAMQNILTAATSFGLGSVWLGVQYHEALVAQVRNMLGIPENIQIMGIAAIGYGAEHKPPHSGIEQDKVHKDRW